MAPARNKILKIAVYCGSADGVHGAFINAACELGRLMAERGCVLVYGGGGTGLMGDLARTMLKAGGNVIGVMPQFMIEKEAALTNLPDMRIVKTMHERKAQMAELSDAFIALPGGMGTMEELFESWTHTALGLADKPCGLLNTNGFYDHLLNFIQHATAERFIRKNAADQLIIEGQPAALLDRILQS
jgi:hypothetical protein